MDMREEVRANEVSGQRASGMFHRLLKCSERLHLCPRLCLGREKYRQRYTHLFVLRIGSQSQTGMRRSPQQDGVESQSSERNRTINRVLHVTVGTGRDRKYSLQTS